MADTGWKLPGAAIANRTIAGSDADWTDSGNILADDTNRAAVSLVSDFDSSSGLAGDQYDFSSIPAGSTIDGIEVEVNDGRVAADLGGEAWNVLKLILADNSDGSDNRADEITSPDKFVTTDVIGGAADLWSETISRADVQDADWGVFIAASIFTNGDTFEVDTLRMKVYYTEGGGPQPKRRMTGLFFG